MHWYVELDFAKKCQYQLIASAQRLNKYFGDSKVFISLKAVISFFIAAVVVPTLLPGSSMKFDIVLVVEGSKSINNHGIKATEDSNYYKNEIYELIKNLITKFKRGDDKAQFGLIFFGESNIKQIKAQVSHPVDTPPKMNLRDKSEMLYKRYMYFQFKSWIYWVYVKHPACQ